MSHISIVILFLSLGLDTLAVSLGLGLSGLPRPQWRRVGLTFAFFEGIMPIAGLAIGRGLSHAVGIWAGDIAAGLLILVGVLAIREAISDDDGDADHDEDPEPPNLRGAKLALTGLSVSLDELAVGFSLGALHAPVGPAIGYIAVQAFALTFVGLSLGQRVGRRLGDRAELVSGLVLTLLGIALLIEQWMGGHFL